ncbi:MAG: endonuclease III domain-containing protein [Clostridia bacterium]|nr:endonuclease III domain-containing protein [Clostridia bacterium]MDD4665761.1 endonuclease III domain-containing protein [Clostridia bacterium]
MEGLMGIYNLLLTAYGPRKWWPAQTAFEMMVGAILTQNTTWNNVNKAIANFEDKLVPEFIETVPLEELAEIIRPSGFYNQKANSLKALTEWFKKYAYDLQKVKKVDGEILREELLAVKGIGRETADSILTYALDKPFFIIDTYTRRILSRLGYELPKTYDQVRLKIEANIPKDLYIYNEFHALLVEHAKRYCKKKPLCAECPLYFTCEARRQE